MVQIDRSQPDAILATSPHFTLTTDREAAVFKRKAVKIKLGMRHPKLIAMDIARELGCTQDEIDQIHNTINGAGETEKFGVAVALVQAMIERHPGELPPSVGEWVDELTQRTQEEVCWLVAELNGVRLYVNDQNLILTEADLNP